TVKHEERMNYLSTVTVLTCLVYEEGCKQLGAYEVKDLIIEFPAGAQVPKAMRFESTYLALQSIAAKFGTQMKIHDETLHDKFYDTPDESDDTPDEPDDTPDEFDDASDEPDEIPPDESEDEQRPYRHGTAGTEESKLTDVSKPEENVCTLMVAFIGASVQALNPEFLLGEWNTRKVYFYLEYNLLCLPG